MHISSNIHLFINMLLHNFNFKEINTSKKTIFMTQFEVSDNFEEISMFQKLDKQDRNSTFEKGSFAEEVEEDWEEQQGQTKYHHSFHHTVFLRFPTHHSGKNTSNTGQCT